MKVIVLFMCAVARAAGSGPLEWPGAISLTAPKFKTIIPAQVEGYGYSTSQYISSMPSLPFGYQPQFSYQISIPGYQPVQPIVGASYFPLPAAPIFSTFPILPPTSAAPAAPVKPPFQNNPVAPQQEPAGDEDSAVIEAADASLNQQDSQAPEFQSSQQSLDTKNMPGFPQIPQKLPQLSTSLQRSPVSDNSLFSQGYQQYPSISQFPQVFQHNPVFTQFSQTFQKNPSLPQFPQGSSQGPPLSLNPQEIAGFSQLPQYQQPGFIQQQTQIPGSAAFPSRTNNDKSLNDEDTVSVESA